jgi:hypothetical protein
MNAKAKCKLNPMTVTSKNPIIFNNKLSLNSSKQVYNSNNLVGILSPKSSTVSPIESSHRTDQSSSVILRQKLLHRNKNGAIGVSTNTSKSGRKSYNRSQNNGFKFHNFVVNEEKRACLEEQHGTKKITVSHWKKPSNEQIIDNKNCEESSCNSSLPSQSILETLLAPNCTKTNEKPRINKRKPLHVRRVLRHEQNDGMEQEEPLDLSFKKVNFNLEKSEFGTFDNSLINNNQNELFISESPTESVQHLIKSVNQSAAQASAIIASIKCSNSANFPPNCSSNSSIDPTLAQKQQTQVNSSSFPSKQQKYRQTQRSLIKKRLEETFKQNGFLVKVCINLFNIEIFKFIKLFFLTFVNNQLNNEIIVTIKISLLYFFLLYKFV